MSSIGLSVPPGFTVTTEACQQYQEAGKTLPPGLWEEILDGLRWVEEYMGARLGDPHSPLLLSVRSGAAVRVPSEIPRARRPFVVVVARYISISRTRHALRNEWLVTLRLCRCPCLG